MLHRDELLAAVDKIERLAANGGAPSDDFRASLENLRRQLETIRQAASLADLNGRLSSIDEHLAHIQINTLERESIGRFLYKVQQNTKAIRDHARVSNGVIALIALFWSAFLIWKNY